MPIRPRQCHASTLSFPGGLVRSAENGGAKLGGGGEAGVTVANDKRRISQGGVVQFSLRFFVSRSFTLLNIQIGTVDKGLLSLTP